ncbi:hypothetical protein ACFQX4_03620 [Roseomonas sp. GCM10028921]
MGSDEAGNNRQVTAASMKVAEVERIILSLAEVCSMMTGSTILDLQDEYGAIGEDHAIGAFLQAQQVVFEHHRPFGCFERDQGRSEKLRG